MKCGIADRSAGTSDMVDGSGIWFTHRGLIGIKMESSGKDATLRRSADLQLGSVGWRALPLFSNLYMQQL